MDTTTTRDDTRAADGTGPLRLVAAVAWLTVGATSLIDSLATEDDEWVPPYIIALAATGRRDARWVAALVVALLGGVALAIAGIQFGIGDPGDEGDYGQVQHWALCLTTLAMAGPLAWSGRVGRAVDAGARR